MRIIFAISILSLAAVNSSGAQSLCAQISGAKIIAQDGTFLGEISNKYNSDSVFNEYGEYGSKYSSNSIWNQYGNYGGKYSNGSPFNKYASEPPMIVINNRAVAYLSIINSDKSVNPFIIKACESEIF